MRHELKTEPEYFSETWLGNKTFEIRNNDREFRKSDEVILQEWSMDECDYTGREITGTISYISDFGQQRGYVVFQLINLEISK